MKNKIIYTLFALILASCELTEQPTSYYEMDSYFVTEDKAKMAVVGIYDCIETINYYGQYIMPFFGADDMFMVRGTGSDGTRRDISHYMYIQYMDSLRLEIRLFRHRPCEFGNQQH